jgi:putative FmdB family regulatory protein
MPTYQYACTEPACGNRFELVQSFTDPSVTECPVCSGVVRKVYGSVGVVFKGSGFYRTDSRASATSEVKAETPEKKKSETKSDTKSESKSDSKPAKSESSSNSSGSAKAAATS